MNFARILALAVLALIPPSANADPVSLGIFLANAVGVISTGWLVLGVVALNVYGGIQARRKASAAAEAQRKAYNNSLTDRSVTALSTTPPWRIVYGESVVGGDIVAVFTSDKQSVSDKGNPYTKRDAYKHVVIHIASHELTAIDDVIIEGVSLGQLDSLGWVLNTAQGTGKDYVMASEYAAGSTSIDLASGTGTILEGDEISIPGDPNRYAVATGITGPGTIVIEAPGLLQTSPSGSPVYIGNEFAQNRKQIRRQISLAPYASYVSDAPVLSFHYTGYQPIGDSGFEDVVPTLSEDRLTITNPSAYQIQVNYEVTLSTSMVRVLKHLGQSGQTVDPTLSGMFPVEWDATHKLEGLAYAIVTLDLEEPRFQNGPPSMSFRVRGKPVLDTRTDLTGYSQNNALIIRDFLVSPWGFNCEPEDINVPMCNAAANACDALISFTVVPEIGSPIVTSEPTFTCNGSFTTNDDRETTLQALCDSMAGTAVYGAQWNIIAGVWTAPVNFDDGTDELTDDDLDGQIEIVQAGAGIDTLFNGIRGTYIQKGKQSPTDFEPYQNAALRAVDGEDLFEDMTLPWTNANARCKNLALIHTERNRDGQVITYPAKLKAFKLQVGDRVRVSSSEYGFDRKIYRVTDWQFSLQSSVVLTLQEDAATHYDQIETVSADPSPNTGLASPWRVNTLSGLVAASGADTLVYRADGVLVPRVLLTWDEILTPYVSDGQGYVEFRWANVDQGSSWVYARASGSDTSAYLTGVQAGERIVIEATVYNSNNASSDTVTIWHEVVGDSSPPGDVYGVTLYVVPGGIRFVWDESTSPSFLRTNIQAGTEWIDNAPVVWRGDVTEWFLPWPGNGSYSLLWRHENQSHILSTGTAVVEFSVSGLEIPLVTRRWINGSSENVQWQKATAFNPETGDPTDFIDVDWEGYGGKMNIDWGSVDGDGRPADGATANKVFVSEDDPALTPANGVSDGDFWQQLEVGGTEVIASWVRVSGAWKGGLIGPGASVSVEYSVDGSTDWHTDFTTGDIYMRQRVGSGTWSGAIRIVGEGGTPGSTGNYVDYQFIRAASAPSTPTGDNPVGWSGNPPTPDGNPLFMIKGTKTYLGVLIGAWSTPVQLDGVDGADGSDGAPGDPGDPGDPGAPAVSAGTDIQAVSLTADSAGVVLSGQLPIVVTAFASLGGVSDTVNWSWSVVSSDGSITTSITGPAVTITASGVDAGSITITGTKAGLSDVVIVVPIVKVRSAVTPTGPKDFSVFSRDAQLATGVNAVAYIRLNSDGSVEKKAGSGSWSTAGYWYQGTVSGSYVMRVTKTSGSNLLTGTLGSWVSIGIGQIYSLVQPNTATAEKETTLNFLIALSGTEDVVANGLATLNAVYEL